MTKDKSERVQNQHDSCYKPRGDVNSDNPPQSGTGVPQKTKRK